jgi:hypothetical protein
MEHFNKLTPAEAERLAMLAEEAGEIVQIVGKILRHGYESYHPDSPNGPSNRQMLENEIADFEAVFQMMDDAKDVSVAGVEVLQSMRQKRRFTHHQDK